MESGQWLCALQMATFVAIHFKTNVHIRQFRFYHAILARQVCCRACVALGRIVGVKVIHNLAVVIQDAIAHHVLQRQFLVQLHLANACWLGIGHRDVPFHAIIIIIRKGRLCVADTD